MMVKTAKILMPAMAAVLIWGCAEKVQEVSFSKEVKPVIDKHCVECHMPGGEGAAASGFLTDNYDNIMKGTKFGPMVVAGEALSSNLYRLVSGNVDPSIQMPHGKEKMADEDVAKIEVWIAQGALNN